MIYFHGPFSVAMLSQSSLLHPPGDWTYNKLGLSQLKNGEVTKKTMEVETTKFGYWTSLKHQPWESFQIWCCGESTGKVVLLPALFSQLSWFLWIVTCEYLYTSIQGKTWQHDVGMCQESKPIIHYIFGHEKSSTRSLDVSEGTIFLMSSPISSGTNQQTTCMTTDKNQQNQGFHRTILGNQSTTVNTRTRANPNQNP